MISRRNLLISGMSTGLAGGAAKSVASVGTIELALQTRDRSGVAQTTTERVDPKKIGIIAVDVWHYHWCRTWRSRAGSLIPRFNHSFDAARKLGMTLVFSPTNAMRDLNESPQRKATLALANHTLPPLKNLFDPTPTICASACASAVWETTAFTRTTPTTAPRSADDRWRFYRLDAAGSL